MELNILEEAQKFINSSNKKYIEIKTRLQIIQKINKWVLSNQERICLALNKDLSKSTTESILSEIYSVVSETRLFLKKLKKWTKPKKVKSNFFYNFFFKSQLNLQPLGFCLIISSYNYPFQLSMLPLIESLAAGNYNLLKISEKTIATHELITSLIKETNLEKYVLVLDKETSHNNISEIIQLKPNLIFFTGGLVGGKMIQNQATQLGIKTVLELGSSCPVIVDETANLKKSAKKIAWGKSLNSGQTCVSPNTIYVVKSIAESFCKELKKNFEIFYGPSPENNTDLAKIINQKSFDEIVNKVKDITQKDLNKNLKELKIRPEIIFIDKEQPIAHQEIFGPILFVVIVSDFEDGLNQVFKYHNNSLASYYFGNNQKRFNLLIQKIKSGSWNCNEVVLQVGNVSLPFGGIETSGTGRYHGYEGLKTFSNVCSITKAKRLDPYLKYPPYTYKKNKLIKKIFRL